MSSFAGQAPYAPDYASYNWTGAPSNFALAINQDLGGNSRTCSQRSWAKSPEIADWK